MSADHDPTIDAPAVRFDWLPQELPAGPWVPELREALCGVIRALGWDAVHQGEFEPLAGLYVDFTSILPRLMVDANDVDRAADLYTLVHIMLWRRTQILSELKTFNADAVLPFTAYLDRHYPPLPPRDAVREVPRIAYLSETSDLFGSNAVARITVSLMLGQHDLREEAERPILYCINRPDDALWNFAAEYGLHIRDVARPTPSQCVEAVVERLRADDIDILIADTNCAVATMVMQRRPTRVQAMHENGFAPWAIPTLDLAIMGITPPGPGLFDARARMVQTPRNTAPVFQRMDRPAAVVEAVRGVIRTESGVAEPSVVYGFYGRMAKITADYMAAVEAILLRDPDAVFFAGGTGRISPIAEMLQRSPVAGRMVIYNDFIDGHVVSPCLDVFLDSFPFPGGMSCIEAQAHGVPVVWMDGQAQGERLAIIADQRDPRLRAEDAGAFVDIAAALADPAVRADHATDAPAIAARFGDMRVQAEQVEAHLRAAWDKARGAVDIAA